MGEFWIPPEKWKNMSKEKEIHLKKARDAKGSSEEEKLPKQYSSANKMTSAEIELFEMMQSSNTQTVVANNMQSNQDDEELTPQQQKFLKMVRSLHMLQRLRSVNQSKTNRKNKFEGEILVDGGCDTSLVGQGFVVESTTSRKVSVQGFQEKNDN